MSEITYDVRVYKTEVYKGRRVTTYYVRWKVGTKGHREPFRNKAQSEGFRSDLVAAARKGEAFSVGTGRPVSWKRGESAITWYELVMAYTSAKWPHVAGSHRRSIADALTDATEEMLLPDPKAPDRSNIRGALRSWVLSARIREGDEPSADIGPAVRWLERNTKPVTALAEPGTGAVLCRAILDRLSRKLDGSPAAANTANRKRMVLNNLLEYACEIGALPDNPLRRVKWIKPRATESVDPRSVINADQARKLLGAVSEQGRLGEHLAAFFGAMYYAALRPEEAVSLRRDQLVNLPAEGWGEVLLIGAAPYVGAQWTDDGRSRQERGLKHRALGDTRRVPLHPDLVALLRAHIDREGTRPDGRLFRGPRGGMLGTTTYGNVWRRARVAVFGEPEAATSLLARRPYELRHACVSTWLAAGVPAPQVAEWAGHSVAVLLRVYAKCIAGQADHALRRILDVTNPGEPEA